MNKNLIGPYRLIKSGPVDLEAGTITLPLYEGKIKATGTPVWYILTDVSDKASRTSRLALDALRAARPHVRRKTVACAIPTRLR